MLVYSISDFFLLVYIIDYYLIICPLTSFGGVLFGLDIDLIKYPFDTLITSILYPYLVVIMYVIGSFLIMGPYLCCKNIIDTGSRLLGEPIGLFNITPNMNAINNINSMYSISFCIYDSFLRLRR